MSFMTEALCAVLTKQGLRLFPSTNIIINFAFRGPVYLNHNSMILRSKIDAYSSINAYTMCVTSSIGRYCSIGEYVRLGMGQHDITEVSTCKVFSESQLFSFAGYNSERMPAYRQLRKNEETTNVTMGHDVWVGASAIFPSDVQIGHGAVIGAGAVITKDVPPYAVVVGNNRILRCRFQDEIIADLLELKWWDYNLPDMLKQGVELPMDNPQEFIARFKDLDPAKLIPFDKPWYLFDAPNSAKPLDKIQLHPVSDDFCPYYDPRATAP